MLAQILPKPKIMIIIVVVIVIISAGWHAIHMIQINTSFWWLEMPLVPKVQRSKPDEFVTELQYHYLRRCGHHHHHNRYNWHLIFVFFLPPFKTGFSATNIKQTLLSSPTSTVIDQISRGRNCLQYFSFVLFTKFLYYPMSNLSQLGWKFLVFKKNFFFRNSECDFQLKDPQVHRHADAVSLYDLRNDALHKSNNFRDWLVKVCGMIGMARNKEALLRC